MQLLQAPQLLLSVHLFHLLVGQEIPVSAGFFGVFCLGLHKCSFLFGDLIIARAVRLFLGLDWAESFPERPNIRGQWRLELFLQGVAAFLLGHRYFF